MIRTRGIQLPKLALYQAELRPARRKLAGTLAKGNQADQVERGRSGPNAAYRSRNIPEVKVQVRLLTRERQAELERILERRLAQQRRQESKPEPSLADRVQRLLHGRAS